MLIGAALGVFVSFAIDPETMPALAAIIGGLFAFALETAFRYE